MNLLCISKLDVNNKEFLEVHNGNANWGDKDFSSTGKQTCHMLPQGVTDGTVTAVDVVIVHVAFSVNCVE